MRISLLSTTEGFQEVTSYRQTCDEHLRSKGSQPDPATLKNVYFLWWVFIQVWKWDEIDLSLRMKKYMYHTCRWLKHQHLHTLTFSLFMCGVFLVSVKAEQTKVFQIKQNRMGCCYFLVQNERLISFFLYLFNWQQVFWNQHLIKKSNQIFWETSRRLFSSCKFQLFEMLCGHFYNT